MCPAKVLLCKIPILDRCLWTGFLNMTPDRRRTLTHLNLLMSADLIFFSRAEPPLGVDVELKFYADCTQ